MLLALAPAMFSGLLLTGCQSIASSPQNSLLRIVNASPNASGVDVYMGSQIMASNVGTPVIGNYAPLGAGAFTLSVDATGTKIATAQAASTAVAGQQYTLLLTDFGTTYRGSIIVDQSVAAPAGQVSLRFIEDAPAAGDVDVYLVPDATSVALANPVIAALLPGVTAPYVNLAAGTYDIVVTAAGSKAIKYTSAAMTLTGGQVRTVLILDNKLVVKSTVSLLIGDDFD